MKLLLGDCIEKMRELPVESVDAVVTDPPYGINFMGKEWDRMLGHNPRGTSSRAISDEPGTHSRGYADMAGHEKAFQGWVTTWGFEMIRSLKPGGHALVFGGTRTYHRMTCGLEDAGFEIRDCLMWVYGSGFPKSHNLAGGLGTALKPAWEPIVLARKPLDGTVAENVTSYGTGAMNIDASRVGTTKDVPASPRRAKQGPAYGDLSNDPGTGSGWDKNIGRWPANLLLTHTSGCVKTGTAMAPGRNMNRYTDGVKPFGGGVGHPHDSTTLPDEEIEVWECEPDCPIRIMDEQSGESLSSGGAGEKSRGFTGGNPYMGGWNGQNPSRDAGGLGDFGGASRFFYCAKVSAVERSAGVEGSGEYTHRENGFSDKLSNTKNPRGNTHPTVKPIDLMRYLVKLITPTGGTVLDPFMGSGTTGIAAHLEGRGFIGIEQDKEYMRIAKARIKFWQEHGEQALVEVQAEQTREKIKATGQLDLMDML